MALMKVGFVIFCGKLGDYHSLINLAKEFMLNAEEREVIQLVLLHRCPSFPLLLTGQNAEALALALLLFPFFPSFFLFFSLSSLLFFLFFSFVRTLSWHSGTPRGPLGRGA